jgi:hypothetical protein
MKKCCEQICRRSGAALLAVALTAAALVVPDAALAQTNRDYLIGAPPVTLTLRGGLNILRQRSDIFDHTREFLTVERGDLLGGAAGADIGIRLSDRLDLVASAGFSRSSTWSEFRDWEDMDGLPIEQQTALTQVPLALSARYYPLARGRSIGRFAYVPSRWAPYIGAGGGAMWHRFVQEGEFLDTFACEEFDQCAIVPGRLESEGFVPMAQFFGGVDMRLLPRLSLTLDARYHLSRAPMGRDFDGFDRIDLSGLQTTVGVQIRL